MNFEQLLDGATKGPWMRIPYEDIVFTKLNDGCRGVPVVRDANYKGPQFQGDLSFIARCNPAVMREVWAALKEAQSLDIYHPSACAKAKIAATRALALLDGQQPTKEEMQNEHPDLLSDVSGLP